MSVLDRVVAVYRFLVRRHWVFWIATGVLVFAIVFFAVLYPEDRKGERAADRLRDVEPVAVSTVLWHVQDGMLEDVSVVIDHDGTPFTLDLTGVDGSDEVDVYEGWQPAHADGPIQYSQAVEVRFSLAAPPVAMEESDYQEYVGSHGSRVDMALVVAASALLALLLGWTVRRDVSEAPPRRRH